MEQDGFDFAPAIVHDIRRVSPTGGELPPVNGATPAARHSSYTGAVHASEAQSANLVAMRQLWREPRTINDIAALMPLPVSSVCSLKSALEAELEFVDYEVIVWGEGRKDTKRARWRLRAEQR